MAEDVTYEDLAGRTVYQGRDAVQAYVEQTHDFSSDYRFVTVSTQDGRKPLCDRVGDARYEYRRVRRVPCDRQAVPDPGCIDRGVGRRRPHHANRDYWNLAAYLAQVGLLQVPPA